MFGGGSRYILMNVQSGSHYEFVTVARRLSYLFIRYLNLQRMAFQSFEMKNYGIHKVLKRYCCVKNCFEQPKYLIDGIACRQCEGFSYCRCGCETYKDVFIKSNIPSLQEYKFYKTKHYITCCPSMCIKIAVDTLLKCCITCRLQIFCTCYLRQCKTQWKGC